MNLYDQLKPEIKNILCAEAENYEACIECIFENLKTKTRYSDLTIDEVKELHVFSNLFTHEISTHQVLYGEHIFNTDKI